MKIADFFVGLGFDVDGTPELKELDKGLNKLAGNAAQLLAVFASMTAAMGIMLNQTLDLAQGFNLFEKSTGLSANELKRWQYVAGQIGVEGKEVEQSIKAIQQARADIMMGSGNVAPWQLLGISPDEDPFQVLRNIRERIKDLDPAVGRSILGQMGVGENMFAMLRLSNNEFDELEKKFQLTRENTENLNKTNREWAKFKFEISAVRDRIVAELIPALDPVIKLLRNVVKLMANFGEWLNKGGMAAKLVRVLMIGVAAAIVATTAALTALVGVIGLASVAVAALEIATAPILPVLWAASAVVLVAVGSIAALVLVIQDLWTSLQGGEGLIVKVFTGIGASINQVIEDMLRFLGIFQQLQDAANWVYSKLSGGNILSKDEEARLDEINRKFREAKAALSINPGDNLTNSALAPNNTNTNTSNVSQNNDINIQVTAAGDAYETGRAIADPLKKAIADSAYQIPIPAQ